MANLQQRLQDKKYGDPFNFVPLVIGAGVVTAAAVTTVKIRNGKKEKKKDK